MNEKVKQVQEKANEIGHKIDDAVEQSAEKHNLPKWKVWLFWTMAAACAGLILYFVL